MTTITTPNNFSYASKNEAPYQDSISSPHSTEYTEQPETEFSEMSQDNIKRTLSNSSKYYEEISTFEPLNEPVAQTSYSSRAVVKVDTKNQAKEEETMMLQSPASTQAPSRKGSDDTCSDAGEGAEEEEELEEAADLKDWSEKKDKILKNLAAKCKYKELTKVSIPLRVKFSHQEDLMIAKYFEVYGCDWTQISTHFTDRTAMMLKNRYYSHIRKKNLLASMLEEVKGDDEPQTNIEEEEEEEVSEHVAPSIEEETVPKQQSKQEEEDDDDTIKILVEKTGGFYFKKVSVNCFTRTFFELENSIPNVLFDKITKPYY